MLRTACTIAARESPGSSRLRSASRGRRACADAGSVRLSAVRGAQSLRAVPPKEFPLKKSLLLLALLGASIACRSTDERAASAPAADSAPAKKSEAVAAMPIVPAKKAEAKDDAAKAEPVAAVPAMPAVPILKKPSETPAAAAVGTRAERLEALQKEHDEAMNAYYDLFRNAKSQEEMQEIAKTAKQPDTAPFVARAKALLAEDPKDDVALQTIQWLMENNRDDSQQAEFCALVEQHHLAKEAMGDFVRLLAYQGPAGQKLVERLSKESPHESVRGRALFQLADAAMEDRRFAVELQKMPDGQEKDSYKSYLGEERFAKLLKVDPAKAEQEALALFQRVAREYGTVKLHPGTPYETTLAAASEANVFEIQNLAIGKTAPEIEGEDVAGVAFKLSDYRGKVVMLDFWGFW